MSPCANGMSRSFFCAKSSRVAPTKVTAYRSRASPACLKKSSTARKKFLPTWKVPAALRRNQRGEEENRPSRCRNPKNRRWTCYKRQSLRGPDSSCHLRAETTQPPGFVISCAAKYGRENREGIERRAAGSLAQSRRRH